jgi:hypothetical protein
LICYADICITNKRENGKSGRKRKEAETIKAKGARRKREGRNDDGMKRKRSELRKKEV